MLTIYHNILESALKRYKNNNVSLFTLCEEEFYKYRYKSVPKDFWPFLERYISLTKNKTLLIDNK